MEKKEVALSGLNILDIIEPNGAMGCTGLWQVGKGFLFGLLGSQRDGECWEGRIVTFPPDRRVKVQKLEKP